MRLFDFFWVAGFGKCVSFFLRSIHVCLYFYAGMMSDITFMILTMSGLHV